MLGKKLTAEVLAWIADDPDPLDRSELSGLLERAVGGDAEAAGELRDRFGERLRFGTAGLRGVMAAGPNRMNRATVRAATAAVAGWLRSSEPGAATPGASMNHRRPPIPVDDPSTAFAVVVGCDARHRSAEFADETVRVFAGAGIRVHVVPLPCPTPLLAFAVRYLAAAAGVMITASHNPAADNGYKLYLGDGAQVIPPVDAEVEERMSRLGPLSLIELADPDSPLITRHGPEIADAYLGRVAHPAVPVAFASGSPPVVYTPMHGVAGELMLAAIERAGFPPPRVVAAQATPDPRFPTVTFPNPEEPGALDLALTEARAAGASLVLASDPDGDRLAVAVPRPSGRWQRLSGDQVGSLLGAFLLRESPGGAERLVVSTIVSSTMLAQIAAAAGARFASTLTGFKWITRAEVPGARFVFGYEEALGYQVGTVVRDKDGIGAALAVLRMASAAADSGRTLLEEYDDLERAHGVHLTSQVSVRIAEPAPVMRALRSAPPREMAGVRVRDVTDYLDAPPLPSSHVLRYEMDDAWVAIRPSGTEPKIKAYFEVIVPVSGSLAVAREKAAGVLDGLRGSFGGAVRLAQGHA